MIRIIHQNLCKISSLMTQMLMVVLFCLKIRIPKNSSQHSLFKTANVSLFVASSHARWCSSRVRCCFMTLTIKALWRVKKGINVSFSSFFIKIFPSPLFSLFCNFVQFFYIFAWFLNIISSIPSILLTNFT